MLSIKYNYQELTEENSRMYQPVDSQTNFLAVFLRSIGRSISENLPGVSEEKPKPETPVLAYSPLRKYEDFQTTPPTVSGLPEVNKTPTDFKPLDIVRRKVADYFTPKPETPILRYDPKPSNETPVLGYVPSKKGVSVEYASSALNNPAEFALSEIQWGNPLEANYGDTIAQASGHDDARTVLAMAQESPGVATNPTRQIPSEDSQKKTEVSEPTGAWLLTALGLRETAYQETGLFIVGAIILAIGIFALTR